MSQPAERRKPGPARGLSHADVCGAALAVMASDGLAAVSFRSVSGRLGVNPMALYTYVKDKDELLACMYDAVMASLRFDDDSSTESPVEQLVSYYSRARELLIANADLHRLVRPASIAGMDWTSSERLCELLGLLGLTDLEIVETQQTVLQFTMGNAHYWAALGPSALPSGMSTEAAATITGLDPDQFPNLARLAAVAPEATPEERFQRTIRGLLEDACERAQVRTRVAGRARR